MISLLGLSSDFPVPMLFRSAPGSELRRVAHSNLARIVSFFLFEMMDNVFFHLDRLPTVLEDGPAIEKKKSEKAKKKDAKVALLLIITCLPSFLNILMWCHHYHVFRHYLSFINPSTPNPVVDSRLGVAHSSYLVPYSSFPHDRSRWSSSSRRRSSLLSLPSSASSFGPTRVSLTTTTIPPSRSLTHHFLSFD